MNRRVITMIVGIIMVLGSIGLLIWGFFSTQGYEKTTATVTAVEYDPTVITTDDEPAGNDYKVTLQYTVDGKNYTTEINANESDYSVGQTTEIRYDPNNPSSTSIGELSLPLLIGISAAIIIVGAIVIIKGR